MTGRILVVDDIPTNRMILRAKLAAAYYEVLQAENGKDAIAKAIEQQPDLILLDVMMPDMNGFQVCQALKSERKTAHIPIIMVTALVNARDRLRGLECGADDFLSKPINDLALFSRVRNLLRAKFMLDELQLRDSTTLDLGLGSPPLSAEAALPEDGRVLLVPRDTPAGEQITSALSDHKCLEIQMVTNAEEAIDLASQAPPDVFVIHARLGQFGDGLRLVSHLRSRPRTRHAGLILIVPEGDQKTAAKGLDLGASDYIFDPIDSSELIVRLKSQIRRKQISDRLRDNVTDTLRLAVIDPLTGLYNRRYALQHLSKISARSAETGKSFALMILDLDNFKQVNDRHGHATGDLVLKEFSRRIQENLRGIDLVSRIGGEEFLVAMPDTSEAEARIASERLCRVIHKTAFPCPALTKGMQVTVSIGVVLGAPGEADVHHLLEQADQALYASKNDGRNTVTLYNSAAA